jgi:uncharacterized membrane protein YeaQ/YmgE (transglycosylase-associated protein family)
MNLTTWLYTGMIIGVIATTWNPVLSFKRLLFSMCIGAIGSLSGGVVGYLFYGTSIEGLDISVFTIALITTLLVLIARRKALYYTRRILKKNSILLLPEHAASLHTGAAGLA